MKVLPFKVPKPTNDALVYQEDLEYFFYDKLHQHEEIQISMIAEGEGTLIVGNTVNYYKKGDVFVIGGNLPHVFKSDANSKVKSHMLTLFFKKDSFGPDFFELGELNELQQLLKKIENGFKVMSLHSKIIQNFEQLKAASKLDRFIIFLNILKLLSKVKHEALSSFIYEKKYTDLEGKRMRDVLEYTINNYQNDISLDAIATVSAMTKNAFCKYFKKRTNKTYIRFLNELRVEHACKLLIADNDFSIAEIADKSGFNNISNFNRQFKAIKQVNPTEYGKTR
ncbi:helix-turn-helix domain-containing protein [Flavobacteriaceae bacterium R38]|nr:helix-turn-helix domain-containing protein [Flavobacteriaceae bacterium R38]